jgi:hypothetical protein
MKVLIGFLCTTAGLTILVHENWKIGVGVGLVVLGREIILEVSIRERESL